MEMTSSVNAPRSKRVKGGRRWGAYQSPPDAHDFEHPLSGIAPFRVPPMPGRVPPPIPPVLNQGETGTCVAQAITGAASILFERTLGRFVFSEASARRLYVEATGDTTMNQGTYPRLVLAYAAKTGILGTDGKRHRIATYHSILAEADPQAGIEQAIGVLGLPVVAAGAWPEEWMGEGSPILPDVAPSAPSAGGHAFYLWDYEMVAAAVADNIANSWGAKFGKSGRAWAHAATLLPRLFDLWTFTV